MTLHSVVRAALAASTLALGLLALPAQAEMSATDLAKLAQNPVGNLVSVPFQNNTNFNTGPLSGTQNILNIQPVIPIELNKDWNIITRTILPLIWQPEFLPGQGSTFGLGDIQLSAFLSPSSPGPGGLIWGAGAVLQDDRDQHDVGRDRKERAFAERYDRQAAHRMAMIGKAERPVVQRAEHRRRIQS